MRLLLIRHGQTDWNLAGRWQGAADIPLNQLGISQAERLGQSLVGRSFELIISSALQRARDSAGIINRYLQLPSEIDPRFNEISLGLWEGVLGADVPLQNPTFWQRWCSGDPEAAPEQGESRAALAARVKPGLEDLRQRNLQSSFQGEILLVSHKMTIETILCLVKDLPLSQVGTMTVPNLEPIAVEI